MKYKIEIKRKAQKALAKISEPYQTNIIDSIKKLASNPFPNQSKKLTGRTGWRIRIGNYRVIYEVYEAKLIILVLYIGHRREIYKRI